MDTEALANLIVQKGYSNVNLKMFSDDERKEILQKAVEIYLRQGKTVELMEILQFTDIRKFSEKMKPIAEHCLELGDYDKAALIFEKIGEKGMAEFIRKNFG